MEQEDARFTLSMSGNPHGLNDSLSAVHYAMSDPSNASAASPPSLSVSTTALSARR